MAIIITNLLANMVVLTTSTASLTNTPELESYAKSVILTNALAAASWCNLDKHLITADLMSGFNLDAHTGGYYASATFAGRYSFFTINGAWCGFKDELYDKDSVLTSTNLAAWGSPVSDAHLARLKALQSEGIKNGKIARSWAAATNLLDLKKARRLAQAALEASCLPGKSALGANPRAEQAQWPEETGMVWLPDAAVKTNARGEVIGFTGVPPYGRWKTGPYRDKPQFHGPFEDGTWCVTYPLLHPVAFSLPYYEFHWASGDFSCDAGVSGLISNIVSFGYEGPTRPLPPRNYLELLRLPTNAIFVVRHSADPPTYERVKRFPRP